MEDTPASVFHRAWPHGYAEGWRFYKGFPNAAEIAKACIEPHANPRHHVVEIGVGGGFWTQVYLAQKFAWVLGIDVVPRPKSISGMMNIAYLQAADRCAACQGVPTRFADFVWSFGTFAHLSPKMQANYLRSIHRILKDDGVAVVAFACKDRYGASDGDPMASPAWFAQSEAEIRSMCEAAGFVVEDALPNAREFMARLRIKTKENELKIVSMCLYGDDPLYRLGAEANIRQMVHVYPGWTLRIYTDLPDFNPDRPWVEVVRCAPHRGTNLMFARFLAAADPQASHIVFRDADSRINAREKAAVDAWIDSDKVFHVMRDHPDHFSWPMLGGMWGVKGGAMPSIAKMIAEWPSHDTKLDDMRFLAEKVWPLAKANMLHHSSVTTPHPDAKPFPSHLPFSGFVGEIVTP